MFTETHKSAEIASASTPPASDGEQAQTNTDSIAEIFGEIENMTEEDARKLAGSLVSRSKARNSSSAAPCI
jgi:hypothetical protein